MNVGNVADQCSNVQRSMSTFRTRHIPWRRVMSEERGIERATRTLRRSLADDPSITSGDSESRTFISNPDPPHPHDTNPNRHVSTGTHLPYKSWVASKGVFGTPHRLASWLLSLCRISWTLRVPNHPSSDRAYEVDTSSRAASVEVLSAMSTRSSTSSYLVRLTDTSVAL